MNSKLAEVDIEPGLEVEAGIFFGNLMARSEMVSPGTRMERSILNPIPLTLNTRQKPPGLERILHILDHVEHVGSFKY